MMFITNLTPNSLENGLVVTTLCNPVVIILCNPVVTTLCKVFLSLCLTLSLSQVWRGLDICKLILKWKATDY